jgi:hypothetical protein
VLVAGAVTLLRSRYTRPDDVSFGDANDEPFEGPNDGIPDLSLDVSFGALDSSFSDEAVNRVIHEAIHGVRNGAGTVAVNGSNTVAVNGSNTVAVNGSNTVAVNGATTGDLGIRGRNNEHFLNRYIANRESLGNESGSSEFRNCFLSGCCPDRERSDTDLTNLSLESDKPFLFNVI